MTWARKRESGRREPHPESPDQRQIIYPMPKRLRWLRSPTGLAESLGRTVGCREAGYAASLVPKAHRQQVRRIEVSQIPGASQSCLGNRAVGGADGEGKSRVGL